jgi:heat shock protein HslJ
MKAGWLAPVLLLALAGCGSPGADPGSGSGSGSEDSGLRGRTFLSTKVIEGGQAHPLADRTRVTFRFMDDGRLLADAGCNTMSGQANLRGGRLEVSGLGMTEMGCDAPRHEQDRWLATFLGTAPSWRLSGDTLVVSAGSIEITLRDKNVAEPDLPLMGTRWTVDTIIDGQTAASTPAGEPATLVFEQDTVQVFTGCNRGSGRYSTSGNTIRLDGVATTKMACEPDRSSLENAVLAVLNGEVTYDIDSARMTLKSRSGRTLGLRGETR